VAIDIRLFEKAVFFTSSPAVAQKAAPVNQVLLYAGRPVKETGAQEAFANVVNDLLSMIPNLCRNAGELP
jgi:hypothetical protein